MAADTGKFHGIVKLDSNGEISCFCSYDEYLQGKCGCRDRFDCPEAFIEATILPGTRPSDKVKQTIKAAKKVGSNLRKSTRHLDSSIKKGIAQLEKDVRAIKRFKF